MIAVVTGSSGFIGSHLVDALLQRDAEVRALVRPETPLARRDQRIGHWEADLLDDRSVRASPVWERATHVFHLAGVTKGRTLDSFRAGNVFPTANLLAAAAARGARAPRVVVVSSQAAAGPASSPTRPVREDDRPLPIEAYGRSKLQAEQAVANYHGVVPVTIVRPCSVYGPRDRDFLRLFRQESRRIALHAVPREHALSIVHVDDLVRALLLAGTVPDAVGRTYFVADERAATWGELYDAISALSRRAPLAVQIPSFLLRLAAAGGDLFNILSGRATIVNHNKIALARPPWWLCDASRARSELGWKAEIPLQQGLREAYTWYVDAGWLKATPSAPEGSRAATEEPEA
jgi:nucleoside-diphosphate-sugar epimerase